MLTHLLTRFGSAAVLSGLLNPNTPKTMRLSGGGSPSIDTCQTDGTRCVPPEGPLRDPIRDGDRSPRVIRAGPRHHMGPSDVTAGPLSPSRGNNDLYFGNFDVFIEFQFLLASIVVVTSLKSYPCFPSNTTYLITKNHVGRCGYRSRIQRPSSGLFCEGLGPFRGCSRGTRSCRRQELHHTAGQWTWHGRSGSCLGEPAPAAPRLVPH